MNPRLSPLVTKARIRLSVDDSACVLNNELFLQVREWAWKIRYLCMCVSLASAALSVVPGNVRHSAGEVKEKGVRDRERRMINLNQLNTFNMTISVCQMIYHVTATSVRPLWHVIPLSLILLPVCLSTISTPIKTNTSRHTHFILYWPFVPALTHISDSMPPAPVVHL